ncbi:MAG: ATP-binding protein [Candidatus Brocadiae bacterium]|nr:ATP-binding protein [Candidatus Brocadiia bacterium]
MKLSIFGPRGCGKTTYLTCLYAQGGKVGSFAISAKDEPTRNYLAERWHQLFTGTELAPTALGLIPLHLVFSANRQAYDIELQDFAGALVMQDRGQDEVKKKLKDALRKSFQESSGLMIFIEAGEPDFQSQFDRRVELDSLMEVLHEQNNRELITRPIAIVITKWDKIISSTGKSDQAKEVEEFLKQNYENLYALVQEHSQNLQIFASSAFGFEMKTPDGQLDYKKIKPFNLEKPFTWIGSTIDKLSYSKCELFEKDNPKNFSACIQEYTKFCKNVNAGVYYEKARHRIRELNQALWKRRTKRTAILCLTMFLILILADFLYEKNEYQNLLLALDVENSKSETLPVIQKTHSYLASFRIFANGLKWKEEINKKLLDFQKNNEEKAFSELEELYKYRNNAKDVNSMEARLKKYETFLQAYPASLKRSSITTWKQEEESALYLLQAEIAFQELKSSFPKNIDDATIWEQWIQRGQNFVIKYSTSDNVQAINKLLEEGQTKLAKLSSDDQYRKFLLELIKIKDTIEYIRYCQNYLMFNPNVSFRSKIEEKIKEREDSIFENVQQKAKSAKDFLNQVNPYKEYIQTKEFQIHQGQAKKELAQIEENLYESMAKKNLAENINVQNIKAIAEYAKQYQENAYYKTKTRYVSQWLEWYEEIKKGKEFDINIKSASLNEDSSLFKGVFKPDTYVILSYGSEKVLTNPIADNWHPVYNKNCRISWHLESSESLSLELWCTDWRDNSYSWSSPDTFLPKYLNQDIEIEGNRVHLRCPSARWPELPLREKD